MSASATSGRLGPSVNGGAARSTDADSAPLRVLHLHSGNLRGGLEGFILSLMRCAEFAPTMKTEVALLFEGWLSREIRAAGASVDVIGPARIRNPVSVLAARRALGEVISAQRCDVVVTHSAWVHALFAPAVRQRAVGLAHFIHDLPNPTSLLEWWANATSPDVVLCNSHFIEGCGPWLFPARSRRVTYYPALPADERDDARSRTRAALGASPDRVVILQASRLERWKGHELLVAALAEIRDDPRWTCWIAGGSQRSREVAYERQLHRSAHDRGLADRIRFLGQRDDVPALMGAADIHCQSNVGPEPFGQVFIEALSAGLPVVTTNIGGGNEIVTEACGIRVAPEPRAVASALSRLIADPALRASLGRAGPSRAVEMCDPRVRMPELERALTVAATRARSRARA